MPTAGATRLLQTATLFLLALMMQGEGALASALKISTWNMSWLTARPHGDPALPRDVISRSDQDFTRLSGYARHLNADVIGLEEVDGRDVVTRVFPTDAYTVVTTGDPVVQQVGIAVRKPLRLTLNPELASLNVAGPSTAHQLRGGLDVTISNDHTSIRVLVVHLKTGCWDDPLDSKSHSCPILRQQLDVLEDWVLERQDEGIPFAVIGDLNRRLTIQDAFMQGLSDMAPLTLTTAGHASPCWGGEYFIDHILLGNATREWLVPNSLRVMTYKENDPSEKLHLSDHCPVSVSLLLP